MSAERHAKVGVKLTVDDRASKVAERIKRSFSGVRDHVQGATGAIRGFATQALAMAGGMSIDRAVRGMVDFARSTIYEADAAERARRSIVGLFTASSGVAFQTTSRAAKRVQDELEMIGVRAGVSADSVVASFSELYGFVGRAGGGIDDAIGLVRNLTTVSGALNLPMEQLSQSAMGISVGMVRARDPLVQMLKTFGGIDVMSDSFKAMTEPRRMQQLQSAVGRMSDKLKGMPLGYSQLVQGIRDLTADLKEAFGVPIVEHLSASLTRLRAYWIGHKEEIEDFAATYGAKVADFIDHAAGAAVKAFRWIRANWDDIVKQVKRIPYYLAAGYVARGGIGLGQSLVGGGLEVGSNLLGGLLSRGGGAAAKAATAAAPVATTGMGMMGAFGQALPAALRSAPALSAAEIGAPMAGVGTAGSAAVGGAAAIAVVVAALVALAAAAAAVGLAIYAVKNDLGGIGAQFRILGDQLKNVFADLWTASKPLIELMAVLAGEALIAGMYQMIGLVHAITWAIQKLMSMPGVGLLFEMSGAAGAALHAGGQSGRGSAAGDLDPWVVAQRERARERERERRRETERGDRAVIDQGQARNMRGAPTIDARGSHFEIKQDFRDQDPDRIAVLFTRDIARAAEARVSARTSLPFGP